MTTPEGQNNIVIDILKKRGLLSGTSARTIAGFMAKWSIDAYHAVLETHVVDESRLADILSEEFRILRISRLRSVTVDKDALKYLDYERAMAWEMMPFRFGSDGSLHVLIADPSNSDGIEHLKASWGKSYILYVAERSEIEIACQKNYPLTLQLPKTMTACQSQV